MKKDKDDVAVMKFVAMSAFAHQLLRQTNVAESLVYPPTNKSGAMIASIVDSCAKLTDALFERAAIEEVKGE